MADSVIELREMTFRWHRRGPVILDIADLSVGPKERVFVSGPSGSGKTTLLNLLGGVAIPERGRLAILGRDTAAMRRGERDAFRADHIGFVFQMFNLLPYLSTIENVLLPCRFSPARIARMRSRGATPEDEADRLLERLKIDPTLRAQSVATLSTGQQQRVAVARALIGTPEVIIADEPTSALDADARHAFMDLLFQEVAEVGAALVFVSHDIALAQGFDRVLRLPELNRAGAHGRP